MEKHAATAMTAYKFLSAGAIGLFSDFQWPPPGEWVDARHPVVDCVAGVHALRFEQLLDWIDDELWEVELDGAIVERMGMVVAERGRLVRRVEQWDGAAAWAFADACALRSAGFAADALRRASLPDAAARIDRAGGLPAAQDAAARALGETSDPAVAEVVAFAADMVSLAGGDRPDAWRLKVTSHIPQSPGAIAANAAFVAAHAAGRAAVAESSDEGSYAAGFAAEREWQLARFAELLS
jgi:hypothetical protein